MKRLFILYIVGLLLCGCQPSVINNKKDRQGLSEKEKTAEKSIFIKDSSDYSIHFLKKVREYGFNHIYLMNNYLIINHKDTVAFPDYPKIGMKKILSAKKNGLSIKLTIERVNQSTIDYHLRMLQEGSSSFVQTGKADLMPNFYWAGETDKDSRTGISYLSLPYIDSHDSCYTFIRIGKEEESEILLGKLIKNCNGKIRNITLEDFPTLIEE